MSQHGLNIPFYRLALPAFHDARGGLFALETGAPLPFALARVYYIIPAEATNFRSEAIPSRGFHAHKVLQQVAVCVQGSCRFILDTGEVREEITLSSPAEGLYIGAGVWREMHDFSPDCVLMVLADQPYQSQDYILQYAEFLQWQAAHKIPTEQYSVDQFPVEQFPAKRPVARLVTGRTIRLRPIRVDEADFVLSLRLSEKSSRHLSTTKPNLQEQQAWLSDYKLREAAGQEHYFVIESHQGQRYGLVRLYDLQPNSFSWGSWLMRDDAPKACAIESALLVYEYAFGLLKYQQSHFDVRKNNPKVIAFHQRLGAEIVSEDEDNYFFNYQLKAYQKNRQRYRRYLPQWLL